MTSYTPYHILGEELVYVFALFFFRHFTLSPLYSCFCFSIQSNVEPVNSISALTFFVFFLSTIFTFKYCHLQNDTKPKVMGMVYVLLLTYLSIAQSKNFLTERLGLSYLSKKSYNILHYLPVSFYVGICALFTVYFIRFSIKISDKIVCYPSLDTFLFCDLIHLPLFIIEHQIRYIFHFLDLIVWFCSINPFTGLCMSTEVLTFTIKDVYNVCLLLPWRFS